nr:unnamed protein product [Leishmania braziliensis]
MAGRFSSGCSISRSRSSHLSTYSASCGRPSSRSGTPRTSLCGRNGLCARTSSLSVAWMASSFSLASASTAARLRSWSSTARSGWAFASGSRSSGACCATSAWNSSSCASGSSLSGTPATRFDRNG